MHDVCIVGAGPAGLNAALVLGRCGRDVAVFDSGEPRNRASRALHGFLTRDGTPPLALRDFARAELQRYPTVTLHDAKVTAARHTSTGFELTLYDGRQVASAFLLLATGRIDVIPEQPGFRTFYGRGVYHCPYCDGWEHRQQRLVAHGDGSAAELALALLTWSNDVVLCLDGGREPTPEQRARLQASRIRILPARIAELRGDAHLREIVFASGETLPCDALFFSSACLQKSPLPEALGCQFDAAESVVCVAHAATGVPGLYVAGNVRGGVHLAIMAAAEGAEAAIAINEALLQRQLQGSPAARPVAADHLRNAQ